MRSAGRHAADDEEGGNDETNVLLLLLLLLAALTKETSRMGHEGNGAERRGTCTRANACACVCVFGVMLYDGPRGLDRCKPWP